VQACLYSGLLLAGTLYLIHAEDISRSVVLITVGLVTVSLSLRRVVYRTMICRRFERGLGTRNVLIAGAGPEAHVLRHHLEGIRHLDYTFKGFIDLLGSGSRFTAGAGDVVGTLDTLFQNARQQFVDEIFFATSENAGSAPPSPPSKSKESSRQLRQDQVPLEVHQKAGATQTKLLFARPKHSAHVSAW
jgi:FlaA1/EpsC-like NDP-sugar epimerase